MDPFPPKRPRARPRRRRPTNDLRATAPGETNPTDDLNRPCEADARGTTTPARTPFSATNRQIRISPIRLIDAEGEQQGVVPTDQALRMAQDAGLDLVEIAPNVRPPVCRILDYGKWKYEQQKKNDKQRAQQRHTGLKEVKIRTTKIDPHDLGIKTNNAKRFLEQGHKVQVTLQYRGREMAHQEIGRDIMDGIKRELFMISKVEQDFRMQGRRGNMVLSPEKRDPKKVRAPGEGESITVGTRGVPLNEPGDKNGRAGGPGDTDGEAPKAPRKQVFPDRKPADAPPPATPVMNPDGTPAATSTSSEDAADAPRKRASFGLPARNADDAVLPKEQDQDQETPEPVGAES